MVLLELGQGESVIKSAGAENADAVVKNFDLDVRAVFVVAVHNGVQQRFAQGRQGVRKALFTVHGTRDFKRHRHIRHDKAPGLVNRLKQGVGDLPVVNDEAGCFEPPNVDVVPQGFFGKQQHGGPSGVALVDVVELVQSGKAVGSAQRKPTTAVDLFHKLLHFVHGQVLQLGVVGGVGVPRKLQRLQVQVADFAGVERLIGVADSFVIAPFDANGLDREFSHTDHDHGFAVKAIRFDFGNDAGAGSRFDLHQPFVQAFFAERGALQCALVCHAHKHAPAFGICKAHKGFDAGFVKRSFKFLRLCLACVEPVLKSLRSHAWGRSISLVACAIMLWPAATKVATCW